MSKVKLLATTGGGSTSLEAPNSTTGNANVSWKLPVADGSSGQALTTNASGQLAFSSVAGGKFASYAIICDQKAHDTSGGTFTKDGWRDRDLNTEIADADGIVSISSDQFTLGAGTYLINWSAPAYRVDSHVSRLYDVTGSAVLAVGFSAWSADSERGGTRSEGFHRHTITGNNVYKIQHWSSQTGSTDGMGRASNLDDAVEKYTWVKIFKEA